MKRSLLALALLVGAPPMAAAQAWLTLPNGDVAYQFDYSVTGRFLCNNVPLDTCTNNADGSILLTSGDASLRLAFEGLSGTAISMNVAGQFPLGVFTTTYGGTGAFLFPWNGDFNGDYAFLTQLDLHTANGTALIRYGSQSTGGASVNLNCCGAEAPSTFGLGFAAAQPGTSYSALEVYDLTPLVLTGQTQSYALAATTSVVPEPASLVLLATGLIGLVAARRSRGG